MGRRAQSIGVAEHRRTFRNFFTNITIAEIPLPVRRSSWGVGAEPAFHRSSLYRRYIHENITTGRSNARVDR